MDIPTQVVSFLSSRALKLATAESCTAGFIASLISSVPGSGACLDVGFITYSPSGKAGFLGVQEKTMNRYGLTSEEVAREMSEGALRLEECCADVSVSNTGVADGNAGSVPAPGTQCFGWSFKLRSGEIVSATETKVFDGDRNEVRHAAAQYALSRIEHQFYHLVHAPEQHADRTEQDQR
ncbi:CinA domain-containing protein [Caballeronia catudaia]|uniref:CinA domain-containing protein n=1 Tax=Caballeronia catudaia TaxID=1777136 RepID=A0A158CPF7_9BURK|nr:nicotinamide-nucleotide amidohydrolase family protein [Caballeronia catudaia]SAK84159.1 CinA domain-containing protein [Caballeronia catudaia]